MTRPRINPAELGRINGGSWLTDEVRDDIVMGAPLGFKILLLCWPVIVVIAIFLMVTK